MGLKDKLRRAVKKTFLALDDVPRKCVYKSVSGTPVRDLDAGTSSLATVNYPLNLVVFARFSEKDVDKDPALLTDMKMLFPSEDLPVAPKTSDTIVDDQGVVWVMVRRLSDPASVVTILQVRTS